MTCPAPLRARRRGCTVLTLALVAGCAPQPPVPATPPVPAPSDATPAMPEPAVPAHAIIPVPEYIRAASGPAFTVDSATQVFVRVDASPAANVDSATTMREAAVRVAGQLTAILGGIGRPAPALLGGADVAPPGAITLHLAPANGLGAEAYDLVVARDAVRITAARPAGLFHGIQTLRQLLPPSIEHPAAYRRALTVAPVRVTDAPRFAWRGAMLDVSRHFLPVEDVKRYIDLMALYKFNRLHLHLSDDQGWRVEIASWPNLARHGGSTQVGGGTGGHYTQADLRALVAYARERYIEIVPEIDVPGHTNAALSSYPGLNCDGVAPPLYTGIRVGFSAICVDREDTYRFLTDVVREIGAITGPWFHIGGDEVERLSHPQYLAFIERAQGIVRAAGKTMVGWGETAPAALDPSAIVQHWRGRDSSFVHAARGGKVILSPGPRTYLDMKYDSTTILGLQWAGRIEVQDSYAWDPATYLPQVGEASVLGVEAPLWAETLEKRSDYEFMAFPRLLAIAEVGWSPQSAREWEGFRLRLGGHGPRLSALGVNFYRSPQVPWQR